MPKPEWGVKRTCTSCRARFYDLLRSPVVCPKCGTELDLSESVKLKRGAAASGRAVAAPVADEEEVLVLDDADETEEEAEEIEDEEEVPLAIEDEDEEEEVPVVKKGKSEEDAELETFDEDVLIEEDEEGDDDLDDLDDLDDDDLKGV